jgi:CBS domain-containing membrane protein
MITVDEVMSKNPVSLSQYNSLHDARILMEEKKFRHIPIVDDGNKLIGLVTQRTVLANGVSSQALASQEELAQIESGILLADVMTAKLVTVLSTIQIIDATRIIYRKKFGCLPVVDGNNVLVGIITDHDFVGITMQLLEMMEQEDPLDYDDI